MMSIPYCTVGVLIVGLGHVGLTLRMIGHLFPAAMCALIT